MRRLLAILVPILVLLPIAASAPSATADTSPAAPAFSTSKTITRNHLEHGADDVVDTRNFSVSISQTTQLRGHEPISVTWSGAHPTGGIVPDQNSGDAAEQEYPVVVLECRGDDSTGVAADAIDPTKCWTATSSERFQDSFDTAFPPWRIDRYAGAADRTAVAGLPSQRPPACSTASPSEHWVPFRAADGTVYLGGSGGCGGQAPESANVGGLNLPSNTTYGVTHADGTGEATFDMWTVDENASLGCSDTVACSLVVVPIMGVSCDVTGASLPAADQPGPDVSADADNRCEATGAYQPGQLFSAGITSAVAVAGALWWTASNWQNRVTVPLQFATSSHVCDVVDSKPELDIYGSEMMTQTMLQWAPTFCLDDNLFRLKHVQTPEPQARNLLASGGASAIFTSYPDPSVPSVIAPVAFTGFAISFTVDDASGNPLQTLRLTPRLLAKLLTESYPAINAMKQEYTALADNPLNMSLDPEFTALNPGLPAGGVNASQSASTLLALSSDSDVMYALTSYITNDPEARAWLDGAPDPWGMVVNPNYKAITLPVSSWPLLDTFEPPLLYASHTNTCLSDEPVPYLPLVAAPLSRLSTIALNMQFAIANSQTVCKTVLDGSTDGEKLVPLGRQTVGFRFMLGVTTVADARRYGLRTASLQTNVDPTAAVAFTNTDGRTFVAPTDDALKATGALLAKDSTTNTWPVPYASFRTDPRAATAYPGAMVVYAQVRTGSLSGVDATNLTTFLTFASARGQTTGVVNGALAPGSIPLTSDNGLQDLAAATAAAAAVVNSEAPPPPSTSPAVPVVPVVTDTTPATAAPVPVVVTATTTKKTTSTTVRPVTTFATVPVTYATIPIETVDTADIVPIETTPPFTEPPTTSSTVPPTSSTDAVRDAATSRGGLSASEPPPPPGPTAGPGSSTAGRALPMLLMIGLLGLLGASMVNLATNRRTRARARS
ncbi:MAG: hypothetical protein JWM34_2867 [Ilumatobacteraceae bacterium]|nr:hypothetical protein [Ilumatobacteraceae bacterium]